MDDKNIERFYMEYLQPLIMAKCKREGKDPNDVTTNDFHEIMEELLERNTVSDRLISGALINLMLQRE